MTIISAQELNIFFQQPYFAQKHILMKKRKTNFEADFWAGYNGGCPLQLFDAFFRKNSLSGAKDLLFSMMEYPVKKKVLSRKDPSAVFYFYLSLRSFIRAGFKISLMPEKYKHTQTAEYNPQAMQGALSDEEYADPFLVFQKAFNRYSLKEFDFFITGIAYFSLGPYGDYPEGNSISPFLHLEKMLDAAQVILERRIKDE